MYKKSIIFLTLLFGINNFLLASQYPNPFNNFKDYVMWYPNHYTQGLKKTFNLKYHKPALIAGSILIPSAFLLDKKIQKFAHLAGHQRQLWVWSELMLLFWKQKIPATQSCSR